MVIGAGKVKNPSSPLPPSSHMSTGKACGPINDREWMMPDVGGIGDPLFRLVRKARALPRSGPPVIACGATTTSQRPASMGTKDCEEGRQGKSCFRVMERLGRAPGRKLASAPSKKLCPGATGASKTSPKAAKGAAARGSGISHMPPPKCAAIGQPGVPQPADERLRSQSSRPMRQPRADGALASYPTCGLTTGKPLSIEAMNDRIKVGNAPRTTC